MTDIVTGHRVGGFVVFEDNDGLQHAVRYGAVLALSDGDAAGSDTLMQIAGNRYVMIRRPFSEVLGWFQ